MSVRFENNALSSHLLEAPVQHSLFHLEIGNAVTQKSADAVRLFEERHQVTRTIQLLGRSHARRPGSNDGDALAGACCGRFGLDQAFFPRAVHDGLFDHFNADRRLVDAKHASCFARRGADAASKLREVIRRMQDPNRFLPFVPIHQIVPIRNDVVHRTARMAKGNAAIHAASRLRADLVVREGEIDFKIILHALRNRAASWSLSRVFLETGDLTHESPARRIVFRPSR